GCDDGVGCTDDSCNETTDSCDNVANNANCADDGLFCNGSEYCDPVTDCSSAGNCFGQSCDEVNDVCVPLTCDNDGVCETGEDCDSCPADCIGGSTTGAVCGNGVCEAGDGEDCASCPADCNGLQNRQPSNRFCCGDGDGQNPVSCGDSRCSAGGLTCTDTPQPQIDYCCGDLTCEGPEDSSSCEIDCGPLPPTVTMHVGDLDATSAPAPRNRWSATVTVTVHDDGEPHASVVGATVTGSWSAGATGSGSCTTTGAGQCSIAKGNIRGNSPSATFSVTDVTLGPGDIYDVGANHDPDVDSDGTSITVLQP
ncbi:MAG: hypothetical protein OEM62_08325, partial [Acidobacteriota bacterium]|nr:hypothetical protein [Acidobacteriota bacterium]